MKRRLEMDDVRVGMYVTVLRGEIRKRSSYTPEGLTVVSSEDKALKGNVLEVMALDFPYISVASYAPQRISRKDMTDPSRPYVKTMLSKDLRDIQLMQLSKDYVLSLVPDLELREDSFFEEINGVTLEENDDMINEIFKDL